MSKRAIFIFIWIGCILGTWAVLPYAYYIGAVNFDQFHIGPMLLAAFQAAVIYGIACRLGFVLLKKVDFDPFNLSFGSPKNIFKEIFFPGCVMGTLLSFLIFGLDKYVFHGTTVGIVKHPPVWASLLASIYGGLNEEVLTRLFLLTLLYFLLCKLFQKFPNMFPTLLWCSIFLTALLFALGHLPALFKIMPHPSLALLSRVIVLNSLGGIVFGWLYCKKSFWTAVVAHFTTDLFLHVIL